MGTLPTVYVRTPEAQKAHEQRVKDLSAKTPEELYRVHDRQAMSNPANPYNAALGEIGLFSSIAGASFNPWMAALGYVGDTFGQQIGNKASNYLFDNPDKEFKLNSDISLTPRQIMKHGTGFILGGALSTDGQNIAKDLLELTKIRCVPNRVDQYYRTLHNGVQDKAENAIKNAFKTGEIRTNPLGSYRDASMERQKYIGPYFHRGKPSLKGKQKVIVTDNTDDLQWASINSHATNLEPDKVRQYTPLYNGVPNRAPVKYFHYYERGNNPISKHFWFKQSFQNANTPDIVLPFHYNKDGDYLIHMDHGNHTGFNGNGAYIKNSNGEDFLFPGKGPKNQRDFIWFNLNKPYSDGINGKHFTRAFVISKDKNIDDFLQVRSLKEPAGQWNPQNPKSFVLKSEYVTPYSININRGWLFNIDPITGKIKLVQ